MTNTCHLLQQQLNQLQVKSFANVDHFDLQFWRLVSFNCVIHCLLVKFLLISGYLLKDREDEFAKDLYSLSQESLFNLSNFEEVIDKIRSCVAEVIFFIAQVNYRLAQVVCQTTLCASLFQLS